MASETILSVKDLRVRFQTLDGTIEAVKGISIKVNAGETVAVVGEERDVRISVHERPVQVDGPAPFVPPQHDRDDRLPLLRGDRDAMPQAPRLRFGHREHHLTGILIVHAEGSGARDLAPRLDVDTVGEVEDQRARPGRRRPAQRPGLARLRSVGVERRERVGPRAGDAAGLPVRDEARESGVLAHDEVRGAEIHRASLDRPTRQPPAGPTPAIDHAHRSPGIPHRPSAREPRDPPADHRHVHRHPAILSVGASRAPGLASRRGRTAHPGRGDPRRRRPAPRRAAPPTPARSRRRPPARRRGGKPATGIGSRDDTST